MRHLSGFLLSFQKLGFSLVKRENPASPAGAQEGRHQWFPPSDFLPFPERARWLFRTETMRERQRIFLPQDVLCASMYPHIRSVG